MKTVRPRLTDLELQVLTLMSKGVVVKAIGARLGITQKAVSSARRRALRRNRVSNYLQLGILLQRYQVLTIDERGPAVDKTRALQ